MRGKRREYNLHVFQHGVLLFVVWGNAKERLSDAPPDAVPDDVARADGDACADARGMLALRSGA